MRAAITGANGFLGACLAKRLVARGDRVVACVRAGADLARLEGCPCDVREGGLQNLEALAAAFEGVDVVFHLAGLRRAPAREAFFRVNAEGTRGVCDVLATMARPPRLIHCSSLAAVGPRIDSPDERAPLAPQDWYGQSKAEAERIVLEYRDRLPIVVARPTRILGPGDRENLLLFRLAHWKISVALGGGERPISTIDVADVVEGLLLMAERPQAVGETFFLNRDVTTLDGLQAAVAQSLGVTPRRVPVAPWMLRGAAALCDGVSKVTGKHLPLNRKLAQQLLIPGWTCSTRKAEQRLGFQPRVPLVDSMRAAVEGYRAAGWIA